MKKQALFIIGLSILLSLIILTDRLWGPLERRAYDVRFRLVQKLGLGRSHPSGRVVVVGIEEKAITKEKPLIFLYPDLGRFLTKMQENNVTLIGIDLIPLHRQAEKLPAAVSALFDDKPDSRIMESIAVIGNHLDRSLLASLVKVSHFIPVIQAFHGSLIPYYYASAHFMKYLYLADIELTDGSSHYDVIRGQKLMINGQEAFAATIYRMLAGKAFSGSNILINYRLAGNVPLYSFTDVMNGRVGRDKLAGKAVILTIINGYEDVHAVPITTTADIACISAETCLPTGMLPGGFIHALAAETLLTETSLHYLSPWLSNIIMVIMIGLCLAMTMRLRLPKALSGTLCLMVVYFIGNIYFFAKGEVAPLFPQLLAPLLVIMSVYPYRYVTEERQKEWLEHELRRAADIQRSILPSELPKINGFDFGARIEPAYQVGGDFYDIFRISSDKVGLLIGDVSDKGMPSALFMARTHALIMAEANKGVSAVEVIELVNSHIMRMHKQTKFVTVLYGILDLVTHEFNYARAGHEPPLILTTDGSVERLPHSKSIPIGLMADIVIDHRSLVLLPGTTLLIYTDGMSDCRNANGAVFGIESIKNALSRLVDLNAQRVCDTLIEALNNYQDGAKQDDDVALVAIHVASEESTDNIG